MFHPTGHLNKHGFFEVGNEKFYSKLDAIQYSIEQKLSVTWNFNDDVFSKLDWKQEPPQSLTEMYSKRAQDLRDRYDYLVIMFSGGADSTAVLDTFIKNNLRVDEIFVYHWLKGQDNDTDSFMNGEIVHAALPYLENNLPEHWNTKVRTYDCSDFLLDKIKDPNFRQRSFREINNVHNLAMISKHYDLHLRFSEYIDLYKQGKTIAFVWGEAKPKIGFDQDARKHFFCFEDHYAHCPQPRDQEINDPNCNHELFFDDPDHPLIKVKQSHVLLRVLKQINHRTDIFTDPKDQSLNDYGPLGFQIGNPRASLAETFARGRSWYLDRNAFNFAIYPRWDFLTYHQDKQVKRVLHPAHQWIEKKLPVESKKWFLGYIDIYGRLPDEWKAHRGGLEYGIKRLQIRYYLE